MVILERLLIYLKEHKYLFFAQALSLISACFSLIISFCSGGINAATFFMCIIPVLLVFLVSYIGCKTFNKHPKITKVVTTFINVIIIFVLQAFILLFSLLIMDLYQSDKVYDNPKQYSKALNSINFKGRVEHFPLMLPKEASDIELSKCANSWFGSEAILVKFTIDREYIDKELEKHKYISVEKPGQYKHKNDDAMLTNNSRIDLDGFTFYVISDRDAENLSGHSFPYHYGIAVNYDENKILYYYACPD